MYEISMNGKYQYLINEVVIKEKIFDEEKFDYTIRVREDFIEELIDWIAEAKGNDKKLMIEDLKYLIKLPDKFIYSSILTNEYIAKSDNKEEFDKTCSELLKLNEQEEQNGKK